MKKSQEEQPETSSPWLDVERLSEFVQNYGTLMAYVFLGLIVLVVIGYQFTRSRESHSFAEYMRAERVYQQFVKADLDRDPGAFESLNQLIDSYPDLKQKYEGKVAQVLISKDHPELAGPFIEEMIYRSEEEGFSTYLEYTKTTLLITDGEYDDAYQMALQLQPQLHEEEELYAFNLLRLASLEQQLGLVKPELDHWKQILAASETNDAVKAMLSHVKEGRVSLSSYIRDRVAQLRG